MYLPGSLLIHICHKESCRYLPVSLLIHIYLEAYVARFTSSTWLSQSFSPNTGLPKKAPCDLLLVSLIRHVHHKESSMYLSVSLMTHTFHKESLAINKALCNFPFHFWYTFIINKAYVTACLWCRWQQL